MVAGRLRVFLSIFTVTAGWSVGAAVAQAQAQQISATWEYNSVSGTSCRDGSEAGYFLRHRPFDKHLVVFLEGGGSCFNSLTCLANPKSVGDQQPGKDGIFQERDDNPVSSWNFVHIPYCTGDIFAGTQRDVKVPGVSGKQNFVGHQNVQLIMDQIHERLPELETILVTGISAGGFGAIFHYPTAKERWPDSKVVLLDDSGIPLADTWLQPCLQSNFRDLWGMDAALPADCTACRNENGGGLVELTRWLRTTYGDNDKGIIMSLQDNTMRFFYGFGMNDCKPPLLPNWPAKDFEAGVRSLKENYLKGGIPSFLQNGTQHVFISSKSFYEAKAGGQNLASWVQDLLNNKAIDRGP